MVGAEAVCAACDGCVLWVVGEHQRFVITIEYAFHDGGVERVCHLKGVDSIGVIVVVYAMFVDCACAVSQESPNTGIDNMHRRCPPFVVG